MSTQLIDAEAITSYIEWTGTVAVYPKEREFEYVCIGFLSELGEVAGVLKRAMRDGPLDKDKLRDELGDCLFLMARKHKDPRTWANLVIDDLVKSDDLLILRCAALYSGHRAIEAIIALGMKYGLTVKQLLKASRQRNKGGL